MDSGILEFHMSDDKETLIDNLFSAFEDYSEAHAALEQARSEYTGYSPSYALASWYEVKNNARKECVEALDKYVRAVLAESNPATVK